MLRHLFTAALSCLLGASAFLAPSPSNAQTTDPSVRGLWTRLQDLPLIPIHNHLLPNGKIAMWGRDGGNQGYLWDPVTQAITALPGVDYDLFCTGHVWLADGRLFVAGGHIQDNVGLANGSVYDPAANTWSKAPNMNAGRWYPTVTTLANGDALVVSGQVDWSVGLNTLPQVYQAATNTWRNLTGAQMNQPLYPMMFLAPNGKVIDVAPTNVTRWLDTSGTGAWSPVGKRKYGFRDYGSAAMYADGKILLVGGGDPPTNTAEVIDLNASTPAWRAVSSMSVARRQLNTTLLPDGTVLVTGGTSGPGFDNRATPVLSTQLWNPATETWTTLASASVPRMYHSSTLLLPDGRVLSNGSDDHHEVEVFSPPYLFKGARPAMSEVPASIGYGQRFTVQSGDAAAIQKVTLIRLASVTHGFNQNQRMNILQFTPGAGSVDITAPANANIAPPGHYMLFLVNGNGAPSMGSVVQLSGTDPTPPPPPPAPVIGSLSPSNATAGGPAFTLTVNGSNFVSAAAVRWNGAARTTTYVSATRLTAAIPATDIAAAGTAQISVMDPGGTASGNVPFTIAAPAGPTYTLTVSRTGSAATRGTITSSPAGINCGGTCTAAFGGGRSVTLTAKVTGNGVFANWGGACGGTAHTCTLTMDANKSVTATINRR